MTTLLAMLWCEGCCCRCSHTHASPYSSQKASVTLEWKNTSGQNIKQAKRCHLLSCRGTFSIDSPAQGIPCITILVTLGPSALLYCHVVINFHLAILPGVPLGPSAFSSCHVVVYYHLSILRGANLRPSGVVARRRFGVNVDNFSVTLVLEQQPRFAVGNNLSMRL